MRASGVISAKVRRTARISSSSWRKLRSVKRAAAAVIGNTVAGAALAHSLRARLLDHLADLRRESRHAAAESENRHGFRGQFADWTRERSGTGDRRVDDGQCAVAGTEQRER